MPIDGAETIVRAARRDPPQRAGRARCWRPRCSSRSARTTSTSGKRGLTTRAMRSSVAAPMSGRSCDPGRPRRCGCRVAAAESSAGGRRSRRACRPQLHAAGLPGLGLLHLPQRQARELRDRSQGRLRPLPLPHAVRARRSLSQARARLHLPRATEIDPDRDRQQGDLSSRRQARRPHLPAEHLTRLALVLTWSLAALAAAPASAAPAADPDPGADASARQRCFGAAARAPGHRCRNSRLRFSVTPSPILAQITPSAPCTPIPSETGPAACAFGLPATRAQVSFALVGDSHAVHWRAALEVVARTKGWRGVSLDESQCLFSRATTALRGEARAECVRWNGEVLRWLAVHPGVSTVFMSQHRGGGVVAAPGTTSLETKIDGYIDGVERAAGVGAARRRAPRRAVLHAPERPACVVRAKRRGRATGLGVRAGAGRRPRA